jgi:hypothetical protein
MHQQLLDRHRFVLLLHLTLQLGKDFNNCGIPTQLAFLNEHRGERGSHGLRAGSNVKLIVGSDHRGFTLLANAHGRAITNYPILYDDRRQRRDAIFCPNRLQCFNGVGVQGGLRRAAYCRNSDPEDCGKTKAGVHGASLKQTLSSGNPVLSD